MKIAQLLFGSLFAATVLGSSDTPLVFFATFEDKLVPLSGHFMAEDGVGSPSVLCHGDGVGEPVEFELKENHPHTSQEFTDEKLGGFAGYLGRTVAFGPYIYENKLSIDIDKKVIGQYFSCEIFDERGMRGITHEPLGAAPHCYKVELYLLPYDRQTKYVSGDVPDFKKEVTQDKPAQKEESQDEQVQKEESQDEQVQKEESQDKQASKNVPQDKKSQNKEPKINVPQDKESQRNMPQDKKPQNAGERLFRRVEKDGCMCMCPSY